MSLKSQKNLEKFQKLINRQRTKPKIWDYSFLLLRNNLDAFFVFRDLVVKEHKTKILDVGCGFKPWQIFFNKRIEYVGVDFSRENSSADFIASTNKLPFANNTFNALIYSEVLEHVENLFETIEEMRRVAKDKALVFISSPFIFPLHGIPYDFQRLTPYFYQSIFKNDEIILMKASNSSFATVVVLLNLFIESTPLRRIIPLKYLVYIVNNLLGNMIEKITDFIFRVAKKFKFKEQFYSLPLGYALILRIKK